MKAEKLRSRLCNWCAIELTEDRVTRDDRDFCDEECADLYGAQMGGAVMTTCTWTYAVPLTTGQRGNCDGERHYYVKQNGQWVCSICGATR